MLVKLFHYLFARSPIALVVRPVSGFGTSSCEEAFEAGICGCVLTPIALDNAVATSEFREHIRPASEFGELEIPQQKAGHRAERSLRRMWIDVVLEIGVPS